MDVFLYCREWNNILSHVEEVMYEAGNEAIEDVPQQKEELLVNMMSNIKETENLVIEEAQRGEALTERIADANIWTFSIQERAGMDTSWEIRSMNDDTRKEIESYKLLITKQEQRIKDFRAQLDYN